MSSHSGSAVMKAFPGGAAGLLYAVSPLTAAAPSTRM